MTSRPQNDAKVKIFKIVQKRSESIGYGLNRPFNGLVMIGCSHGRLAEYPVKWKG